jgi:hypothetical protein
VNPDSSALIHQPFESDFDDPGPGKSSEGNGAQESIWIQDEDAVNLTYHCANMGVFALPCVRCRIIIRGTASV